MNAGLIISSFHHIDDALARWDVTPVVSILSEREREQFGSPDFAGRAVLGLRFDDIVDGARPGAVAPGRDDIARLIDFARENWRGRNNCLCHCRAGSSRSPSAALIVAATLQPGNPGFLVRVARARSYFKPNLAMLRIADDLLGTRLVGLVLGLPSPDRWDKWEPTYIPLDQ